MARCSPAHHFEDQKSEGQKRRARAIVSRTTVTKGAHVVNGAASMSAYKAAGFRPLAGYQLRYIYFLNPAAQERWTVPVIPFSRIDEMGASMYRGEKITRVKQATGPAQGSSDGAAPIHALQP